MFKTGFEKTAKVFVYRNIRKSKDAHTYSVKGSDGRVQQHTQDLSLINPEIKVSKKGMERVRKEGVKNVHAGIKGDIAAISKDKYTWREITYDPKKYETFIFRDTKLPVEKPDAILLTPKGAVAGFQKVAVSGDFYLKALKGRVSRISKIRSNTVTKSKLLDQAKNDYSRAKNKLQRLTLDKSIPESKKPIRATWIRTHRAKPKGTVWPNQYSQFFANAKKVYIGSNKDTFSEIKQKIRAARKIKK